MEMKSVGSYIIVNAKGLGILHAEMDRLLPLLNRESSKICAFCKEDLDGKIQFLACRT